MNSLLRRLLALLLILAFVITGASCKVKRPTNNNQTVTPAVDDSWREPEDIGEIYTSDFSLDDVVQEENGVMDYIRNELLLVASLDAGFDDVKALVEETNGKIVGYIELTGDYQISYDNMNEIELKELIDWYKSNPLIDDAMLNYVIYSEPTAVSVNDTWGNDGWDERIPDGNNWGMEAIKAREAWEHAGEMSDINIGIVDSGFDFSHEDLDDIIAWNRTDQSDNHGTHVLGTFAAEANNRTGVTGAFPSGINGNGPAARAYTCVLDDVNNFIQYKEILVELIARNVKVINISQGFNEWKAVVFAASAGNEDAKKYIRNLSDPLGDLLQRLLIKGYDFIICQAAGNNSSTGLLNAKQYVKDEKQDYKWLKVKDDELHWNAYYGKLDAKYNSPITAIDNHQSVVDRIIVVGAVKNNGKGWFNSHKGYSVCSFSNWGDRVDVLAPGHKIYSSTPGNRYEHTMSNGTLWSGTSMATPHVSGVAAMVWATNNSLTGDAVKRIVCGSISTWITDTFPGESLLPYDDTHYTNGLIDAQAAVEEAIRSKNPEYSPGFDEKALGAIVTKIVDRETNEPVKDDDGNVISEIIVSAYRVIDGKVAETSSAQSGSDIDGEAYLLAEAGDYELRVEVEGYKPATIVSHALANETVYADWIKLEKDDGSGIPTPAPTTEPIVSASSRDIVISLDISGSMAGQPMNETKKAAASFIKSTLEEDARIGLVAYNYDASVYSDFTRTESVLSQKIDSLYANGGTNIEDGLRKAEEMLVSGNSKKRIIVLMSDGCPNNGLVGDELIEYAASIKEKGILIYTLGFFDAISGSDKTYAQNLMERIASEGCHYEVENAEDLVFFFEDMSDQINGQKYIYIRIACPVDVSVTYKGETLNSKPEKQNTRTSFGTLTFEESDKDYGGTDTSVKILRLKDGVDYDIKIKGNGNGKMTYTIGFMDEEGEYADIREFKNIRITKRTVINTVATESAETVLNIDKDGDGKIDEQYKAAENGRGRLVEKSKLPYIIGGASAVILIIVLASIIVHKLRKCKLNRAQNNQRCSFCGCILSPTDEFCGRCGNARGTIYRR